MDRVMKFAPWLLSAVLAIFLALNWQHSRAALEQKDAEVQSLKQQYNKLVSEANTKIEEANVKVKQLADDANKKIEIASQREVQVRVSFRKALLSSGNVAAFTNLSGQTIAITADVERPASGQKRSFAITIDPGKTKEIGEREGWAFVPGDTVKVGQPDHKGLVFTAP